MGSSAGNIAVIIVIKVKRCSTVKDVIQCGHAQTGNSDERKDLASAGNQDKHQMTCSIS